MYNFIKKIFSISNESNYKILRIFGIKIKFPNLSTEMNFM